MTTLHLVASLTAALAATTAAATADASPRRFHVDAHRAGSLVTARACDGAAAGTARCHVHVVTTADGTAITAATPQGYGATDLERAYAIAPAAQQAGVIAIVDAYGYKDLASDLAQYRAQYGLPACTVASGCLTIVNQEGATSPLPKEPPSTTEDWTIETALDVDMASAGCPTCKIVVVQADDSSANLFYALAESGVAKPTVVSNSWGFVETGLSPLSAAEQDVQAAGAAVFASTGDSGYDTGNTGPWYPSTSAYAIAVGGTVLAADGSSRGFSEVAWPMAGSSCSAGVARLASASAAATAACAMRAAADISAVAGDPGLAIYNKGAWLTVEGTSASTPLVAAMFAGAGLGAATPDSIPGLAGALVDITSGTNGSCGNALCKAAAGWDGPTGYGTPNAAALATAGSGGGGDESVNVVSPQQGDTVQPGFVITLDVTGDLDVVVGLDGAQIGETATAPYTFASPAEVTLGAHELEVVATDAAGGSGSLAVEFTVAAAAGGGGGGGGGDSSDDGGGVTAGCNAGGAGGAAPLALVMLAVAIARRRGSAAA
nr:MYXO-CTERM sorting domain-containing protein [Kofleriaceae bacterium]